MKKYIVELTTEQRKELSTPVWLDRINYYRMLAHVPAVSEDTNLSAGDLAAATYVVRVGPLN